VNRRKFSLFDLYTFLVVSVILCLTILSISNIYLLRYYIQSSVSHPTSKEIIISEKLFTESSAPSSPIAVIGYAISLTNCPDPTVHFKDTDTSSSSMMDFSALVDGAAVLAQSIHLSSYRYDPTISQYDYQLYAILYQPNTENVPIHSTVTNRTSTSSSCSSVASILSKIGYQILYRDVPITVADINGSSFLKEKITSNGCCGEKELIKLWAYTLIEHPIVVHLDIDTLILQPMDSLFHIMMKRDSQRSNSKKMVQDHWDRLPIMWPESNTLWDYQSVSSHHSSSSSSSSSFEWYERRSIDAFFTRDYNMVAAGRKPSKNFVRLYSMMYTPPRVDGVIWVMVHSMEV